jgi:hypothetical protein
MKTLLILICVACAATNALLLADWMRRGEAELATGASALLLGCIAVAVLVRRLRW